MEPQAAIEAHVANTQAVAALSRARFINHIVRYVPTADRAHARTYWNSSKFKRVRLLFRRTLARLRKPRPDKIEPFIVANPGTYQIDVLYMDTDAQLDEDAGPAQDSAPLRSRMALVMIEIYSRRAYMVPIKGRSIDADILPAYKELLKQVEQHFEDMEKTREDEGRKLMGKAGHDRPVQGVGHFPSFVPMPETIIYGIEGDKEFEPLRPFNDQHKIMTDIYVSKWLHNAERQGGDSLGIVDAFARTIKHMVRTYALTHNDTQWKTYLPKVVALYNDSPHSGIHQLTPDFVSLHPMVMWKDMVDKAAHNDKVEDLLKDERPHHTGADVEALQGIRKRYNYRLPGPLKVGDFIMVLKDKQSILTKGPRRNKYQVYVVHTVLRKNRCQVVKLTDVKAKQLALTDAQWPDAIEAVGRVYAREELYKLSEEDKVNVDDGKVEQELRHAVEDYIEARADEEDSYEAADDEDEEEDARNESDPVPARFREPLQEQAAKLVEDGITSREALLGERKRLQGLNPVRKRTAQDKWDAAVRAYAADKALYLRRVAVGEALRALGPVAGDMNSYAAFASLDRDRKMMVMALQRMADRATPEPEERAPDHVETRVDVENVYDIAHWVVTEWEQSGALSSRGAGGLWNLKLDDIPETLDLTEAEIRAYGNATLLRELFGGSDRATSGMNAIHGMPGIQIMYRIDGNKMLCKVPNTKGDTNEDRKPHRLAVMSGGQKAYQIFGGFASATSDEGLMISPISQQYHSDHYDDSDNTVSMWAFAPSVAIAPKRWRVTLSRVGQAATRHVYYVDPECQTELARKVPAVTALVAFDSERDMRAFLPESVRESMMEAYRKVKRMTAAEQNVLAAKVGLTGAPQRMHTLYRDDPDTLFLELASLWTNKERGENDTQFKMVRATLKETFADEWGEFPHRAEAAKKKDVKTWRLQMPEAGGVRAVFDRELAENEDKTLEELEALTDATRDLLSNRFNWRSRGRPHIDDLVRNKDARALFVRWFVLGALTNLTGAKAAHLMNKFRAVPTALAKWDGGDDARAIGHFESGLNAFAGLPAPFRDAVRTLYQRDGHDEQSESPSVAELQAWATAAEARYIELFKDKSPLQIGGGAKPKGGATLPTPEHIKALRGYLIVQVLWRAWLAKRKASEGMGIDGELKAWTLKNLYVTSRRAENYMKSVGEEQTRKNLDAAMELTDQDAGFAS